MTTGPPDHQTTKPLPSTPGHWAAAVPLIGKRVFKRQADADAARFLVVMINDRTDPDLPIPIPLDPSLSQPAPPRPAPPAPSPVSPPQTQPIRFSLHILFLSILHLPFLPAHFYSSLPNTISPHRHPSRSLMDTFNGDIEQYIHFPEDQYPTDGGKCIFLPLPFAYSLCLLCCWIWLFNPTCSVNDNLSR